MRHLAIGLVKLAAAIALTAPAAGVAAGAVVERTGGNPLPVVSGGWLVLVVACSVLLVGLAMLAAGRPQPVPSGDSSAPDRWQA